jgi:hypothetical protein
MKRRTRKAGDGWAVEECGSCGKKWDVREEHCPTRDKDQMRCTCDHLMREWNGGITYLYREHKG